MISVFRLAYAKIRIFISNESEDSVLRHNSSAQKILRRIFFKCWRIRPVSILSKFFGRRALPLAQLSSKLRVSRANIHRHLALLRSKRWSISEAKNQVLYSLRSSLLIEVLDIIRRYF